MPRCQLLPSPSMAMKARTVAISCAVSRGDIGLRGQQGEKQCKD